MEIENVTIEYVDRLRRAYELGGKNVIITCPLCKHRFRVSTPHYEFPYCDAFMFADDCESDGLVRVSSGIGRCLWECDLAANAGIVVRRGPKMPNHKHKRKKIGYVYYATNFVDEVNSVLDGIARGRVDIVANIIIKLYPYRNDFVRISDVFSSDSCVPFVFDAQYKNETGCHHLAIKVRRIFSSYRTIYNFMDHNGLHKKPYLITDKIIKSIENCKQSLLVIG